MSIRESALAAIEPHLANIAAHAPRVDADGVFPTDTIAALRDAGLFGLVTPTAHGGLGGSFGDAAAVVEAIGQRCGTSAMVVCMHYAGAAVLAAFGSAAVNAQVAAGEHLSTLAFSEVGSRSHFWAPLSTATAQGDGVVLNAKKGWVTSAGHATGYVWSSQPLSAEGASTIWLVDRGAQGLSVPSRFDGVGLRGNDSTPVHATDVVASEQLGADGDGFNVMMGTVLPIFNLMNAACSVGLIEGALAAATSHVSGKRYGHVDMALSDLPVIRALLAKARCQADATRTLWLDACAAVDTGRPDAMLRVLQVKATANDAAMEITQTCMRICGGSAFRKDLGVDRYFRDAQAGSVMAPTSDVLYDFIGKAVCGMDLF